MTAAAVNPSQVGETAVENIRNALQLLTGEQSLHIDEVGIVDAVKERLMAALQDLQKNPPASSRYSPRAREFISSEISHLVRDKGYPLLRAIAAAINQARRKGFKVPAYKGNPLGAMLTIVNPDGAVDVGPVTAADRGRIMATGVHSIAYRHASDGRDYEHEFEKWDQVRIKVLDDHRALLFSGRVPIIQMFEVED